MRDLPGHHLEALDGPRTLLDSEESPLPAQFRRLDREMRRRHRAGEHVDRVTLRGHQEGDLGVRPVAGGKEGQAMRVIPVQVAEQDRSAKWAAVHQPAQPLKTGAGVEHQRWRSTVARQRHAGGISPVPHERGAR